jgi:hypothetical protein
MPKTAMGGISFELNEDSENSEALNSGVTMGRGRDDGSGITTGWCTGVIKLPKVGTVCVCVCVCACVCVCTGVIKLPKVGVSQ